MIRMDVKKSLLAATGEIELHLNLEVEKGEFITLYGPSGAGKTSALRILSGLMRPDSGYMEVNGRPWFSDKKNIFLAPQKRKIGFVFQDYALFPNLTVRKNLEFAQGSTKDPDTIQELIRLTELENLQDRLPEDLSGGQKQRAALARALVQRPDILLLDEPLSALDSSMRAKLQGHLRTLHERFQLTTILVSHDIGEIHKLSDRVITLDHGMITNSGKPLDVFSHHKLSGKFQFTGKILDIQKQEVIYVVSILVNQEIVRIIAHENEVQEMQAGDQVLVAAKAFNPLIMKLSDTDKV